MRAANQIVAALSGSAAIGQNATSLPSTANSNTRNINITGLQGVNLQTLQSIQVRVFKLLMF